MTVVIVHKSDELPESMSQAGSSIWSKFYFVGCVARASEMLLSLLATWCITLTSCICWSSMLGTRTPARTELLPRICLQELKLGCRRGPCEPAHVMTSTRHFVHCKGPASTGIKPQAQEHIGLLLVAPAVWERRVCMYEKRGDLVNWCSDH